MRAPWSESFGFQSGNSRMIFELCSWKDLNKGVSEILSSRVHSPEAGSGRGHLFAQDFAGHLLKFFEGDFCDFSSRECFSESRYLDDLNSPVVCFVHDLVAWFQASLFPNFFWREQLSLLTYSPGPFRCQIPSRRNKAYSSENISVARQIVIRQRNPT